MSSHFKSIAFATIMCLVCSVLLTAASSGLKVFQEKNILLDRQRNILASVGLVAGTESVAAEDIRKRYIDFVQAVWVKPSGQIVLEADRGERDLPIYLYRKDNELKAYIVPINTRGLWGKIHGYLALKSDGETISGFTVYKHSETPGLGGEIEKRWFQQNFVGKKIVNREGGFVSVSIAKGTVKDRIPKERQLNYVDGISGATLTGKFLTAGLKEILSTYEPVSVRFRKHRTKIENSGRSPGNP